MCSFVRSHFANWIIMHRIENLKLHHNFTFSILVHYNSIIAKLKICPYIYWTVHHCDSWRIKDQLDVTCYFYFTSYVLDMFRTLIYPSSGACDYSVELPHWSYCSWFDVCWSFGVVGLEWYLCCWLKNKPATRIPLQPNHTETSTHDQCGNSTE